MRNIISHDSAPQVPQVSASASIFKCRSHQHHLMQGDPRPVLNVPRRAAESLSLEASCPWRLMDCCSKDFVLPGTHWDLRQTWIARDHHRSQCHTKGPKRKRAPLSRPVFIHCTSLHYIPRNTQMDDTTLATCRFAIWYAKYAKPWMADDRRSGAWSFSDPVATSPWSWAEGIQDPTAGEGLRKLAGVHGIGVQVSVTFFADQKVLRWSDALILCM